MVLNFLKSGYQKVKDSLSKAGALLGNKIRALWGTDINEDTLNKLEKLFYEADLGIQTTKDLVDKVRQEHRLHPKISSEELILVIRQYLLSLLPPSLPSSPSTSTPSPLIILIVGVNGNGKTTTVAKLAKRYQNEQKSVLLAAADTFRAAATEQLDLWAQRLAIPLVKGTNKSDPAAVAFDAVTAAKARGVDILLIDTAGRLQTKSHLMQELEKIKRSCKKVMELAPHETWLVLDATTGQNAIDQAKIFHHHTPLTGLVLTKLDGTAKGGIVISIQKHLGIPVKFIGTGEGIDDLEAFDAESFINTLLA